jgi:aminoglycoside 3-N-acetyltransferase
VFTKIELKNQLEQLGGKAGSITLVHTSLRAVGTVEGGAEGLLDALIGHFTREGGLLCIPTHTWHHLDDGQSPMLDMSSDDTCLGALSAVAIRDGRGIRTENPTHSMVVFGDRERALDFIKDEGVVETPTAPESCYGKLCTMGGQVLLIGVAHNRNTYLHAVDEILNTPNRMGSKAIPMTVRSLSGEEKVRLVRLYETDYSEDISWRFPKYETAFRYHGCITDGFIGNAPVQLCDARRMKETVERILRNSGGNDPLKGEQPIPQLWYCNKEF